MKNVIFELGGKSPALIFEDADIERAAQETENSINWNSGQTCMANSRIYVQKSVAEAFVNVFKRLANSRVMGDPTSGDVTHGPQADRKQYDTVRKYIALGNKSGRSLGDSGEKLGTTNGGKASLLIHPVVYLDQPEDSQVMKEEIFGPVVTINTFESEEEAIQKANNSELGLYAALYTKNLDRAMRLSKKLESGMVGVNCTSPTGSWDLPFGGYKSSGTGRESLLDSMDHYLEHKSVYIRVSDIAAKL